MKICKVTVEVVKDEHKLRDSKKAESIFLNFFKQLGTIKLLNFNVFSPKGFLIKM